MGRAVLPHVDDHEYDILTDELIEAIDHEFFNYENASHNGSEWQQMVAHSRLDGILYTLDATCALSTKNIRDFMVSCTKAKYLPFGYTRYRT